jgi:hypothetical protein
MLKKNFEKIVIEGSSILDGERLVARFFANIDLADPKNIVLSTHQLDKELCKERRSEVRADEVEFEDYAYALQDKVIAATVTE